MALNLHNARKAWFQELKEKCEGKYKRVRCPFLIDDRCSIYFDGRRPNCCRNFPQEYGHCAFEECGITHTSKDSSESSALCQQCARCCKIIMVPDVEGVETEEFILKWFSIDCETCAELFADAYWDNFSDMLKAS